MRPDQLNNILQRIMALEDAISRRSEPIDARQSIVVRTFEETTYPTAATRVFACRPVSVSFNQTEGATVTLTPNASSKVYVANLSADLPAEDSFAVADAIGDRWQMFYAG
jgi:hypothetical protein